MLAELDRKVAQLTGFPESHQEPLNVLRYNPGQEYVPHWDYIEEQGDMPCGGRIATVLMYLNALPEGAGGETHFLNMDVKCKPDVAGAALYWYNVHATGNAGEGLTPDERTLHAGLPVKAGCKFVCCKWIQPFPFRTDRDILQPHDGD